MPELPWEDSLLERKVQSDLKDLLKTLVAFANSVRPGHIATILIGEKDDGSIQGVDNADSIQKTVRDNCNEIYPPILWRSRVYEKEGKTCVRVEIEHDGETPHFGGAAWIRRGSVTEKATDEVFQRLIEFRLGKVRKLAEWIDKQITIERNMEPSFMTHYRFLARDESATLRDVNSFWVTFEAGNARVSEPLERIVLSWDDKNQHLKVLIRTWHLVARSWNRRGRVHCRAHFQISGFYRAEARGFRCKFVAQRIDAEQAREEQGVFCR